MTNIAIFGNEAGDAALVLGGSAPTTVAGRNSGNGWGSTGGTTYRLPSAQTKLFVGMAMTAVSNVDSTVRCSFSVYGDSGATQHLTVGHNATTVTLWRGGVGGTVLGTAPISALAQAYNYFELEETIADAGGVAKVRLNGVEVITYSGDTKNGGTANTIDTISFNANGVVSWFDDMYVNNDSGSAPDNTYWGDVRILPVRPSGVGNSTQFTPDSGANWSRVNENPYSAANYVSSSTSGHKDLYAAGDISTSLTVLGVRVAAIAKNPDGGAVSVQTALRSGGTDYAGSAVPLGPTDAVISTLYPTDPATGVAWTPSGVNAAQIGVVRV